jgi:molybdopterin-guanine dinucleotide biosynthesis protein A
MPLFEGFILIGGKSSRMGQDKFALKLNGKTFLEIAVETLQQSGIKKISAVVNKSQSALNGHLTLIKDIYQNRGALGGIHSALVHSESNFTVILACDYPFVSVELIEFLMKIAENENDLDAFAPLQLDGKIQPLCALYKTEVCRRILSEMLENAVENYSVRNFLNRIKTRYIEFAEIASLRDADKFFFNVNTLADFEQAKKLL